MTVYSSDTRKAVGVKKNTGNSLMKRCEMIGRVIWIVE